MRALLELLAIFAGIYLFDCIHWARRETVAFRTWWKSRTRLVAGEDIVGNERHGVVFAQPLLPFGRVFLTQPFPLSLTRDTAASFVSQATNPGPRPAQVGRVVRFDEPWKVSTEARRVLIENKLFVEAGSDRLAARIARLLRELRDLDLRARGARIDAELDHALDSAAAAERLAAFEPAVRDLRVACTAELLLVFVVTPAAGYFLGLNVVWIPLLAALVLVQALIAFAFVRAHRALFPDERGARRGATIVMALSPPVAMRAVDALSRDLLADFHPLAAAHVLLRGEELEAFAAGVLRDAHHPLPIGREGTAPEVTAASEAWRARVAAALVRFAVAHGLRAREWAAAPAREAPDCVAWCPRCVRQFTVGGTCAQCWDLPLRTF